MKNVQLKLMSVKDDGLPEPDMNKIYLVVFSSGGYGYGSFNQEYTGIAYSDKENGMMHYENVPTGKTRWFLDSDSVDYEEEIESYLELPGALLWE